MRWLGPPLRALDGPARDYVERGLARLRGPRRSARSSGAEPPVRALLRSAGYGVGFELGRLALVLEGATATFRRGRGPDRWRAVAAIPAAVLHASVSGVLIGPGKLLSALQTRLGVEPAGRPLEPAERALLRRVFGEGLDLAPLRIKSGPAGLASWSARPFVHGEVLFLGARALEPGLLVHEAVHFWQHQTGGPGYMAGSLWSQAFGRGYDWACDVPRVPWRDLEVEQQAQLIEDAFRAGYFDGPRDADPTLGPYLDACVASLRAGRGAAG